MPRSKKGQKHPKTLGESFWYRSRSFFELWYLLEDRDRNNGGSFFFWRSVDLGIYFFIFATVGSTAGMVKLLHSLILGRAKAMILKATNMNDYLAMAVGGILTFIVACWRLKKIVAETRQRLERLL